MNNNKLIGAGVGGALIASFFIVFLTTSGGGINNFGNVSTLEFIAGHRDVNCEAFNKLGVTKNGVFSTVASGRDGFNPIFDTNLLTITQFGQAIDSFHIQLWLSCRVISLMTQVQLQYQELTIFYFVEILEMLEQLVCYLMKEVFNH